ncbi:hypothetical protein OGATHE_005715 [Ogataea polymorpha]|uniref:Uncharacterized protein n=1 Tax=Ogataea polymorpha TaxID=460523 RepID=A0A9P8NTX4_9ASCO|nr:hypothetical protein OGATHE_005715 [Ogataea polymorpha]
MSTTHAELTPDPNVAARPSWNTATWPNPRLNKNPTIFSQYTLSYRLGMTSTQLYVLSVFLLNMLNRLSASFRISLMSPRRSCSDLYAMSLSLNLPLRNGLLTCQFSRSLIFSTSAPVTTCAGTLDEPPFTVVAAASGVARLDEVSETGVGVDSGSNWSNGLLSMEIIEMEKNSRELFLLYTPLAVRNYPHHQLLDALPPFAQRPRQTQDQKRKRCDHEHREQDCVDVEHHQREHNEHVVAEPGELCHEDLAKLHQQRAVLARRLCALHVFNVVERVLHNIDREGGHTEQVLDDADEDDGEERDCDGVEHFHPQRAVVQPARRAVGSAPLVLQDDVARKLDVSGAHPDPGSGAVAVAHELVGQIDHLVDVYLGDLLVVRLLRVVLGKLAEIAAQPSSTAKKRHNW